ncbi:hypothetical protein ACLKA6_006710 [Drosophila palustris]
MPESAHSARRAQHGSNIFDRLLSPSPTRSPELPNDQVAGCWLVNADGRQELGESNWQLATMHELPFIILARRGDDDDDDDGNEDETE